MDKLRLRPWTVKAAKPWVLKVHRRLKEIQGAMWAVSVRNDNGIVGAALVGNPARAWMEDSATLAVLRVAVLKDPDDAERYRHACSMLYGSCSRAARAMGAENLVTYTHGDEHGSSLKASGWIFAGMTDGGEYDRPCRQRRLAVDPLPKKRWLAAWSKLLAEPSPQSDPKGVE